MIGLKRSRDNGMHALRHFRASVLLDAGESVKALASYLGHADPGLTLRTYAHLMPASEEHTRGDRLPVRHAEGVANALETPCTVLASSSP